MSFTVGLKSRPIEFQLSDNGLDYIATLVQRDGLAHYEAPLPDLIAWLARAAQGLILDVGAHSGVFSLLAAAANPCVKVCGFEPLDGACALFNANVALNPHLADRIKLYQLGLSNIAGMADFYETINEMGLVSTSSSVEMQHVERTGHELRKRTVELITLDGWLERFHDKTVSLIKIDVEGHEHAVILGGRATIARCRPFITVEVFGQTPVGPIDDLLFEEQYLDLVITSEALRVCRTIGFHPDGWNHLLCPAEQLSIVFDFCQQYGLRLDV